MTPAEIKALAAAAAAALAKPKADAAPCEEKPHRSRFDNMSPERYQFWVDEHQ